MMELNRTGFPIVGSMPISGEKNKVSPKNTGQVAHEFALYLKNALEEVNKMQVRAEELDKKLATGEMTDVHQVMIEAQKAGLSLQLTVQIRNKAVEAYQEIMRMQI